MNSLTPKSMAALGLLSVAALTAAQADDAHAYDMDCKVILCLAGGFPAGCGDAYSYMIKRITRFPKPLPPFGFCAMSDGSEYKAHNVSYRYLRQGPEAYDCAEGLKLYYRRDDDEGSRENETAFCYTHTTTVHGYGRNATTQRIYSGRTPAARVNFELNIVIEPNTAHEFRSPLFRINYSTGYVSQKPL